MLKVSTFCSGIGSAEEALKNLGVEHEVVFASEIDKYARQSYEVNHDAKMMINDMCEPDYVGEQYYSDLNISGLPCQAFSLAGKRLGELDKRGVLFYDFYRWVKNQQPKVFVIENVKGLLSVDKGVIFQNWCQLLGRSVNYQNHFFMHEDSLEYNLHYTVLNSKNFGVPQNRERVFIVGIRKDLPNDFRFPIGWRLDKRLRDVLETNVEEKYYLSEKMQSYLINRKDNFNGGKINYKNENDVASCINASSKSIDISDNIIIEKVGFINQDTQASQVYDTDGISPTLSAGTHGYALGYIEVKEATKKGYDIAEPGDSINISNPNSLTRRGRVGKEIANTLETSCNQVVVEPLLIKFSRTENAKKQRKETGTNNFQDKQIEFVKLDISNTITTVQKDNLIIEPQLNQIAQIEGFESEGRIYDSNGLARTIKDGGGGGSKTGWYKVDEKVILIEHRGHKNKDAKIIDTEIVPTLRAESHGHETKIVEPQNDWVVGGLQENQTPRIDGICPTLTSAMGMGGGQTPIVKPNSRIRRLTPLECFRLQAFPDEFFYKAKAVNSDTQLYKQAGNTITVSVIKAIINNLLHILK